MRLFIAIEYPADFRDEIYKQTAALRRLIPEGAVRWVRPNNLHLTLKFLGEVAAGSAVAESIVHRAAGKVKPFEVEAGELGAFPSLSRPRVLWVGLQAPGALQVLQREVESEAALQGFAAEDQRFSPHLTLGRVGRQSGPAEMRQIRAAFEATRMERHPVAQVEALHVFRSELRTDGPVYTRLHTARLG